MKTDDKIRTMHMIDAAEEAKLLILKLDKEF
jgi:hypothetical protein